MSVTRTLASYVVEARLDDVPPDVRHEASRALVNYVGCALGGSPDPAVDAALRALGPYSGPAIAGILGRAERMDPLHAALMNGISSHVHDFDDTTPQNYVHPTSPVASALFAYASVHAVDGRDFVNAFILGFEAESRIANAVYPAHYDVGWHITGTAGVFGAAAAIGRLLGLPVQQMVWALGLAATQAAGLREMFGSMAKAFHPGRAAQNGYSAALLAEAGFTSGERPIEGPRGFAAVQASHYDLARVTEQLGADFNLRRNTYKPFPCGIVNHPTIDGCIQLHDEHHLTGEAIRSVRLRVAPLVLDLCNQQNITRGLQGKFSVYHGAAIGLVRGKAGLGEYSDATVNAADVKRVREATTATGDAGLTEDQAHIDVELADGRTISRFVPESLGNLRRPLSDRQLEEKFRDQARLALPEPQVEDVLKQCWRIESLADVRELVRSAVRSAAVVVLAALLFAGCGGSPVTQEIRIPRGAGGVGFLPLLVMEKHALIERYAVEAGIDNLSVRWIDLGGPAVMNDALLSGATHFAAAGPPAFLTLWDRTRDSLRVGGVAAMTSLPMYLNTRADHLRSLDDLRESDKIAVTAIKVSIPSLVMQMYAARKYGPAEATRFDRYTVSMTHPDAVIALLSGGTGISAHFTSPPFHQRERRDPRVRTIMTSDEVMGGSTTFTMLSTTEAFREKNPEIYGAVLEALEEANRLIVSDKRAAAELFRGSTTESGFSLEEVIEMLNDPAVTFTTRPENVQRYAEFMHDSGSIRRRPASWKELFFPDIHAVSGS